MGGVSATAIVPEVVQRGRVLLFLRGGAAAGDTAAWRSLAGHFAERLNARVYLPDDDGLAAYRWLLDQGRAPTSIVLCGDGFSVLGVLAAARDAGLPPPAGGAVLSPLPPVAPGSPALADLGDLPPIFVRSGACEAEPERALPEFVAFVDDVLRPADP